MATAAPVESNTDKLIRIEAKIDAQNTAIANLTALVKAQSSGALDQTTFTAWIRKAISWP